MTRAVRMGLATAIVLVLLGPQMAVTPAVRADARGSTLNRLNGFQVTVRCRAFLEDGVLEGDVLCKIEIDKLDNLASRTNSTYNSKFALMAGDIQFYKSDPAVLRTRAPSGSAIEFPEYLAWGDTISGYGAFAVPLDAPRPLEFVYFLKADDTRARTDLFEPGELLGKDPANEVRVPLELEPWASNSVSDSQATVVVLETEVAALETASAPTSTVTETPPPPNTSTPSPTVTPLPDQSTIAALETRKAELSTTQTPGGAGETVTVAPRSQVTTTP